MKWTGVRRIAFVPVFRSRDQVPSQIPSDFAAQIVKLALFNPLPVAGGPDQSLRAWVRAASSGRADIDATVLPLQTTDRIVTLPGDFEGMLGNQLRNAGFDQACLVMLTGDGATNAGYWSRFLLKENLGRWMMEMIHGLTGFPDLYHFDNDVDSEAFDPRSFDEMSDSSFTHPTIFTKLHLGWADASTVALHNSPVATYDLQIASLTQPPAGGRVAAVQIGTKAPYMMIEARTKADAFDAGIASEGVIAYRVQWANPVIGERPGHRLPLYMLTKYDHALKPGESLTLDRGVVLSVNAAIPGGFSITVTDPNLHHLDRTALTGAKKAASAPAAIVLGQSGIDDIAYRSESGDLHEIWRDPAGLGQGNLTNNGSAPRAQGNPWLYYDQSSDQVVLLYRGTNNHVHSLYWLAGDVGHDDLSGNSPKAAGNPAGWFSSQDGTNHVVYRGSESHLHELSWQGAGAVSHRDLQVKLKGDPCPYYDAINGTNVVAFRGSDNKVRTLYWSSGAIGQDNLSGAAGTPDAADDPFAWHAAVDDSHHCVYRASNGHIYELSWIGEAPVAGRDLTAITGAPHAVGGLSGGYNASDNTQHVIYCSSDGSVHELWYFVGSSDVGHSALTAAYGGPPSADRPVYFSTPQSPNQHVVYRSSNGHIHELLW